MDDKIDFGSDLTIADFTSVTVCLWLRTDTSAGRRGAFMKDIPGAGWGFAYQTTSTVLGIVQDFSTTDGNWEMTTSIIGGAIAHVAMTYDKSNVANDPIFYLNGAVDATIQNVAPVGTFASDSAKSLLVGLSGTSSYDFDGLMGWLVYTDSILNAAAINRAKYWGRPGGGLAFYQPLMTDKLSNEGTAGLVANGTATGTTVVPFAVPVVRPSTALMGMGVGW